MPDKYNNSFIVKSPVVVFLCFDFAMDKDYKLYPKRRKTVWVLPKPSD